MKNKAIAIAKRWAWLKKSLTMYWVALMMAAPDILAFLPTVKASLTPAMYEWLFRGAIFMFVLFRIKTQAQLK